MIGRLAGVAAFAAVATIIAACGSSGEGGREVRITQGQEDCSPATIDATTGEKLKLIVSNESDKEPYELEGEGGANLEEIIVPEGKTREVGFDVPDDAGTYELKCYVPGDIETIIEVEAKAP